MYHIIFQVREKLQVEAPDEKHSMFLHHNPGRNSVVVN